MLSYGSGGGEPFLLQCRRYVAPYIASVNKPCRFVTSGLVWAVTPGTQYGRDIKSVVDDNVVFGTPTPPMAIPINWRGKRIINVDRVGANIQQRGAPVLHYHNWKTATDAGVKEGKRQKRPPA